MSRRRIKFNCNDVEVRIGPEWGTYRHTKACVHKTGNYGQVADLHNYCPGNSGSAEVRIGKAPVHKTGS
jgi:hypothetical protein